MEEKLENEPTIEDRLEKITAQLNEIERRLRKVEKETNAIWIIERRLSGRDYTIRKRQHNIEDGTVTYRFTI